MGIDRITTREGVQTSFEERLGYKIGAINNEILSISFPGDRRTFHVGQKVAASGRIFAKRGVEGIITKIDNPFEDQLRSSDVIHVLFDGFEHSYMMKAKDLV